MFEVLARSEISDHQRGSQYQALLLDSQLRGVEAPVPPYQLVAEVAGSLVVRDVNVNFRKPEAETDHGSDTYTSRDYGKAVFDLTDRQREETNSTFGSLVDLEQYTGTTLKEVCFSPAAVELVAGWTRRLGGSSVISKHLAQEAVLTPEGFEAALKKMAELSPQTLLHDIPKLAVFVPREDIRSWIESVANSRQYNCRQNFIRYLHHIVEYYEDDQGALTEKVKENLAVFHCIDALKFLSNKPIILQFLTPDEARELTAKNLANISNAGYMPERDEFDRLVELGLAKPEQIEATIGDAVIAGQDSHSSALSDLENYLSDNEINRVKTTLVEQLQAPLTEDEEYKKSKTLSAIVESHLFSADELKSLFEVCIESGPTQPLLKHLDVITEVVSPDKVIDLIKQAVEDKTAGQIYDFVAMGLLRTIEIEPELAFELIKQKANQTYGSGGPKAALQFLDYLPKNLHSKLIREIVANSSISDLIYEQNDRFNNNVNFEWLKYLGTDAEAKETLRKLVEEERSFDFINHVYNWRKDKIYLPLEIFSAAEAKAIVQERIYAVKADGEYEYSSFDILRNIKAISTALDDPDEVGRLIHDRVRLTPKALFTSWSDELSSHFSPDEVMDILEEIWPKSMTSPVWLNGDMEQYLPQDRLTDLYTSHLALCDMSDDDELSFDDIINRLDREAARHFVQKLLTKNPLRLLLSNYVDELLGFDQEGLVDWIDHSASAFAPKSLAKLNRNLDQANPNQQKILEKDKDDLYQAFAWVNHAGLADTYQRLQGGIRTEKSERELLHLLSAAARQIEWYAKDQIAEVKDLKDLRLLVEDVTLQQLGIEQLSATQRASFREKITDTLPFGVYTARYAQADEYHQLLKDLIESTTRPDGYETWRFAQDKPLDELKALGWLPSSINEEQYNRWVINDEQTVTIGEVQNDTVGRDIAELIRQNTEHINISEGLTVPEANERLEKIIRQLGQDLKSAHLDQKRGSDVENIDELESLLKTSKYQRAVNVMYNAGDYNVREIKQMIRDFRAGLPEDGKFLAGRIEEMIAVAGTTLENVTVSDTSDPQTTIEIGAKPVPSCQHYATGSMNENLLGYFDVDVKPLIIRSNNGGIAARAIMRLLQTESGEPVLYVEPAYTSYDYKQVSQAFSSFVAQKAAKMGVAYISQDDESDDQDEEVIIHSVGSRAPGRYSDSLAQYDDSQTISIEVGQRSIIRN